LETPLRITGRQIALPASVESLIRDRAAKLERYYRRLVGCEVVVEGPGNRHRSGAPYRVRIDLKVPDHEITVDRHNAQDLAVAIRDAFKAAKRQLEDYSRVRRGEKKLHEEQPRGHVVRLFPEEEYGFIQTPDGREVYFHRNSVLEPGFEQLELGTEVRFTEERGDEGPQASSLTILR
jgi:ribosomal subunit interface protein